MHITVGPSSPPKITSSPVTGSMTPAPSARGCGLRSSSGARTRAERRSRHRLETSTAGGDVEAVTAASRVRRRRGGDAASEDQREERGGARRGHDRALHGKNGAFKPRRRVKTREGRRGGRSGRGRGGGRGGGLAARLAARLALGGLRGLRLGWLRRPCRCRPGSGPCGARPAARCDRRAWPCSAHTGTAQLPPPAALCSSLAVSEVPLLRLRISTSLSPSFATSSGELLGPPRPRRALRALGAFVVLASAAGFARASSARRRCSPCCAPSRPARRPSETASGAP